MRAGRGRPRRRRGTQAVSAWSLPAFVERAASLAISGIVPSAIVPLPKNAPFVAAGPVNGATFGAAERRSGATFGAAERRGGGVAVEWEWSGSGGGAGRPGGG